MDSKAKGGLLVGAGFLLGTVGIKALTSTSAKKVYAQGVAQGLKVKSDYENIVEQAKAQVDDIVSEAKYINVTTQQETSDSEVSQAQTSTTGVPETKPTE